MKRLPNSQPNETRGSAFSRVDLLGVIALAMLLAIVLTPGLARTRVNDRSLQCLNNLRQLTGKPSPADLFVIIEENPNYIDDAAFAAPAGTIGGVSASWPEYPSILHGGGCALSFADGHSEIKLWKDRITLAGKAPPPPFLSPTNDLRWLGERTTALLY
jgi:prepilin-type processing-associated H-X9-DG protein